MCPARSNKRIVRGHQQIFLIDQAGSLLGLSIGCLKFWHKTGLYSPRKPRIRLRYDQKDIFALACIAALRRNGVSAQRIRSYYIDLIAEYADEYRTCSLLVLYEDGGLGLSDVSPSSGAVILDFQPLLKAMLYLKSKL